MRDVGRGHEGRCMYVLNPTLTHLTRRRWKSISDGALAADAATDTDLGFTAMTFSLLRSHKYDVTPGAYIDVHAHTHMHQSREDN